MEDTTLITLYRKLAQMFNKLDFSGIADYFAEDIVYESQNVFVPLTGKNNLLYYLDGKFKTIRKSNKPVFAEIGIMRRQSGARVKLASVKRGDHCIILSQGTVENKVALVFIKASGGLITRIDICTVVPHWSFAIGTGEYPS